MIVINMGKSSIFRVRPSGRLIVDLRKSLYEATQKVMTRVRETVSTAKSRDV